MHLGKGAEDVRRKRFKERRKARSDLTEREPEDNGDDSKDPVDTVSPINMRAACAGFMLFFCLITLLICLWYVYIPSITFKLFIIVRLYSVALLLRHDLKVLGSTFLKFASFL